MSITQPAATSEQGWTKSSYSTNEGPECVEVSRSPAAVRVRDSKDPHGPRLAFSPAAWTDFVAHTRGDLLSEDPE